MLKMKLSDNEKTQRKEMRTTLFNVGGWFVYHNKKTILCFMPEFPGSEMVQMSVANCNPKDKFSRKYGEFIALMNMNKFNSVYVPIELADIISDELSTLESLNM